MITKRVQKIGGSRGVIFSAEMRQHLGNAEVVEVIYVTDGILIKNANGSRQAIKETVDRAISKYPRTLKRLAE